MDPEIHHYVTASGETVLQIADGASGFQLHQSADNPSKT
jgi:hypothetical protein